MRSEMLLIEGQYSQLRHKYETMELDFKQALTHNEQAGPISCEMRSLISTLQTQNKQLKAEVTRYRRKCEETVQEREMVSFLILILNVFLSGLPIILTMLQKKYINSVIFTFLFIKIYSIDIDFSI